MLGGPKHLAHFFVRLITSSNIYQFSFFHYQNRDNICNNIITKGDNKQVILSLIS